MTNQARHMLYFYSPVGDLLTILPDSQFAGLSYGLKDCEPGVMNLLLPGTFDMDYIPVEGIIEIHRAYGAGPMKREGDTGWFIRRRTPKTLESGEKVIYVTAYSALVLARRRIVAYDAGTSYTDKLDISWDDMMREVMDENYGPGASYGGDPDRDLEPWLTVEADTHYGASYLVNKAMARKKVLEVLQEIVGDVRAQGIYASFDVVRVGPAQFEFRIFVGARGVDHSSDSGSPVVVSEERRNLASPEYDDNWEDEANFIYAAGQGMEDERIIQTAQDDARIGIGPFNRHERLRDARQAELAATVAAEANSALEEGRPKRIFSGYIRQTPGCIYGVHWGWGDIVTAEYMGRSWDCHVTAISVTIQADGTEEVTGQLWSEQDVE